MNKALLASFVIAIALSATVIMAAGENKQIALQGKLTDASGKPLDGPYSLTFKIYSNEVATAGETVLWTDTQSVTVSKGLLQTKLGSITNPLNMAFDKPYWVEIAVGSETLSPRYAFTASPYALTPFTVPAASVGVDELKVPYVTAVVTASNAHTVSVLLPAGLSAPMTFCTMGRGVGDDLKYDCDCYPAGFTGDKQKINCDIFNHTTGKSATPSYSTVYVFAVNYAS